MFCFHNYTKWVDVQVIKIMNASGAITGQYLVQLKRCYKCDKVVYRKANIP